MLKKLRSGQAFYVRQLIKAQNNFDNSAYANCFADTAAVFDKANTYKGKTEIKNWINRAIKEYQAVMKPIAYSATETPWKLKFQEGFPEV